MSFRWRIPTTTGCSTGSPQPSARRTAGYYGKQGKGFDRFFLAVPARGGQTAEVRIYTVQD